MMGTTVENETPRRGVLMRAGNQVTVITDVVAETTYGRRGGSLYPIALLAVAAICLVVSGGPVLSLGVGLLAILLLGIWTGGGGGRRT
jgi:hypothetical protein